MATKSLKKKVEKKPVRIQRDTNKNSTQIPNIYPKTQNQKHLVDCLENDTVVVAAGSSGVGKTFIACHHAAKQVHTGRTKQIILIRAYQPLAGRSIGFLPGELEEKLFPYYAQMISYLKDFLTPARVDIWLKSGVIEICSLETIRGRSWDYATVIVDESQNLYAEEVQALTTRIGEGSQMIFLGDDSGVQTDVKNKKDGLSYLLGIVDKYDIPNVGITYLGYEDILRHDIVREFVIAFDKEQIEEKERHAKKL